MNTAGDWDLRGVDVDTRFAKFSSEPLSDEEMFALGRARMVIPRASIGDKLYLIRVSDAECYYKAAAAWGFAVAEEIAKAKYQRPGGQRRRTYCEGYRADWGAQAALDGIALATLGSCPALTERGEWFGVAPQTYRKIRDFVGGVSVDAISEFRFALEWALGYRHDRVFEGRYNAAVGEAPKVRIGEAYAIVG